MDRSAHNLELLAIAEAISGGVMAVTAGIVLFAQPDWLADTAITMALGGIGLLAVCYYFSVHHWLKKTKLNLSVLALTSITAINLALLVFQTGGLESAFYSFWLMVIVVFGMFGPAYIYGSAAFSLIFLIVGAMGSANSGAYVRNNVEQLAATLVASVLAHWVHRRWIQAGQATAAAASRIGEEQLKSMTLMNSISEGMLVIDATRKIQFMNSSAGELTGWDAASAIGLDCELVIKLKNAEDQDLDPQHDPISDAWQQNRNVLTDKLTLITKSGRRRAVSLSVSPLFDLEHKIKGAIALIRDIGDQQETERQRSEFISTASHEMRTPIAALEGYISLSMNPATATVDDRARTYLTKAHSSIVHLGTLFKDLLSSAKLEEGNFEEKIEIVELGQLIQELVDNLQFIAQKKGLAVVYRPSSLASRAAIAPLYYVKANTERLREVITNLVDNAIKFTEKGGVTVSMEGDNDLVTVNIRDTGAGIAPEDISHLFQKFYRVDNSATRTTGGTGLGLYLCRKIIEHYQGKIWVKSNPGVGSTFSFNLPRVNQNQVPQTAAPAATPVAEPTHIPAAVTPPTPAGVA